MRLLDSRLYFINYFDNLYVKHCNLLNLWKKNTGLSQKSPSTSWKNFTYRSYRGMDVAGAGEIRKRLRQFDDESVFRFEPLKLS